MENNYISFKPQDSTLPGYIRFSITTNAVQKIHTNFNKTMEILANLSRSKVLIFMKTNKMDFYNVFTNDGIFYCTRGDNGFLIIGFSKNTLKSQNQALKQGICFKVTSGIIIQLKLKAHYEVFQDICNGVIYENNAFQDKSAYDSMACVGEAMDSVEATDDNRDEDEIGEYAPEKKLLKLLQTAESYTLLSSQKEEKDAIKAGQIPYTYIKPIDFHRIDRVAYEFGVTKLDEQIFKQGVRVEVEDKEQEKQIAEITALVKEEDDKPAKALILLFDKHIDIDSFHSIGWFHLSISTVNKDVQMEANMRIREGKAKAKFMDNVIGKGISKGFEKKDLTNVVAKLQEKKYPPNKSQMDAIVKGIESEDVFLVMGPPGTGKTTVILEWVKYFVKHENKKVLVSSQNNKAVDNVLARIAEEKDIDIIRIGSEAKLQSEVIPYMFENKVSALRESIKGNVLQKIACAEELRETWTPFRNMLNEASDLIRKKDDLEAIMAQGIVNDLKPMYDKLILITEKYQEIKAEKFINLGKLSKRKKSIEKYQLREANLWKWVWWPWYFFNSYQFGKNLKEHHKIMDEEYKNAEHYRDVRNRYTYDFDWILEHRFVEYDQVSSEVKKNLIRVQEQPRILTENIWGFFKEVRHHDIRTEKDMLLTTEAVGREDERCRSMVDILRYWEEKTLSKQNYALNEIVLESVDLVGATCIGINSQKRFANLDFDVTIIDEAGQIQVHNALVPMSVSNKLIMLGDHKQIPPTADSDLLELCDDNAVDTELLRKSLFEVMYKNLCEENKMMLDTQYRMPAEIAGTISDFFYDSKYFSPSFKENQSGMLKKLSERPYIIIDTSESKDRKERKIESGGSDNRFEAEIVEIIISYIIKNEDWDLKEVGIMSAYKAQVQLIKNKLQNKLHKDTVKEMVATLDSFQGQERDLIIYSFTKSSSIPPYNKRIGFLNELRRLNVAMTRCKKTLILIGDMKFLSECEYEEKDEDGETIYEGSEKQFSEFIRKVLKDVDSGKGERISCQEFRERMKDGTYDDN